MPTTPGSDPQAKRRPPTRAGGDPSAGAGSPARGPARYLRSFSGFGRDARLFLLTTFVYGAALSLYWTDFNLYLEALGLRDWIGLIAGATQLAGVVVALPASALSDRFGRRAILMAGCALVTLAFAGFLAGTLPLLFLSAIAYGAGTQTVGVVQTPFMAEHTEAAHRNEFFAAQYAITSLTNFVMVLVGGWAAETLATRFGLGGEAGPFKILLVVMLVLSLAGLGTMLLLTDDRPRTGRAPGGWRRLRLRVSNRRLFVRLLLPGFLISLGAGQLIPFLNVFVKGKFNLDLSQVNASFALTSLGTGIAILAQPALARRLGKIGSVVVVQAASIPFIVVLGFSPILWTVIGAMAVRNSLMNAGNPIYNAFAMEQVAPSERASYSAAASLLWSLGWTIAGPYYQLLQRTLGFSAGFTVDFITIVVLYSVATALYWFWFGDAERRAGSAALPAAETAPPLAGG